MSPKILSIAAGLTASGLLLFGMRAAAVSDLPREPGPDTLSAVPTAPAAEPTVLLLTDGRVLTGRVSEDDLGYTLRTKVGEIHYTRRQVEKAFLTVGDAYRHKKSLIPANDPDERMKLAHWCLANKLTAEAQAELDAVLKLSPGNRRAKAMLFQMQSTAERTAATKDAAVMRSSGQAEPDDAKDAPGVLNLSDLREEYRRNPKAASVPEIFDLPEALAVRRYQEFAREVHPVLQRQCAKCHNERSRGSFQLIEVKAKRDLMNDLIVRANLDATLRLVDKDDLGHSQLLTSSLMPHKPAGQPIFLGPNQPSYRMIAGWVKNLKPAPTPASPGVVPAGFPPPGPANRDADVESEAFAADRAHAPSKVQTPRPTARNTATMPVPDEEPTPAEYTMPGTKVPIPNTAPEGMRFPTSPLEGGPDAEPVEVRGKPQTPAARAKPAEGAKTITVPGIGTIPVDERSDPKKTPDPAKPKKPGAKKIDNKALERVMQQRNGAR